WKNISNILSTKMVASNAFRFIFLILAISMAVMSQDDDSETGAAEGEITEGPEAAAAPPAPPAVEPRKDGTPSFGLCSKHSDCDEPNACFDEIINKKKFKICVTRDFHAMPLDMKKKLKYPAHLV
ncbi:unnamed protein product, partial [Allacma fusca]